MVQDRIPERSQVIAQTPTAGRRPVRRQACTRSGVQTTALARCGAGSSTYAAGLAGTRRRFTAVFNADINVACTRLILVALNGRTPACPPARTASIRR